jgi:fructose-1,6-bisphosphatase II / sedoheptulose-1,7-bisphosphatase
MGVTDFNKKFSMEEMASGDVIFAATGVTDGNMLEGIRYVRGGFTTHSVVMRSKTGTVRWIKAMHPTMQKFRE